MVNQKLKSIDSNWEAVAESKDEPIRDDLTFTATCGPP